MFRQYRILQRCCQSGFKSEKLFHVVATEPTTEYLKINDAKSGNSREIAYKNLRGPKDHGILYIPGFMTTKSGNKAIGLHRFCSEFGFPYIRYDPAGLGESIAISLKDARFSHWIQDAKEVLLKLTKGPQLIVASSMGAWIALSLAEEHPEKFAGLVLIAPALNSTQRFFDLIKTKLPESVLDRLKKGGSVNVTHPQYGTFPISFELAEHMYQHELDVSKGLQVSCPVRIIHGTKDPDIPFECSIEIMNLLRSPDVLLTYIKDGDHRLSEERYLQLLFDIILQLEAVVNDKVTARL